MRQQNTPYGFQRKISFYILWLLFLLVGVRCNQAEVPPTPPPQPVTPVTENDSVITQTVGIATNGQVAERQLVVWAPEFFTPFPQENSTDLLADVYRQFEQSHPGITIEVQIKDESGEASLLNYLKAAQRVAPAIMPDVVLIDAQELWQLADLGIIQPLDAQTSRAFQDLYSFTLDAVKYNDQILGIPYTADIIQLVYDTRQTEKAPATWAELFAMGKPYLFSASMYEELNLSLLLNYVAAGGQLREDGVVNTPTALQEVLNFMAQGKENGVTPASITELSNLDAVWAAFVASENSFAQTLSRLPLRQVETPNRWGSAPIPTATGENVTVGVVWAFAIINAEPEQQKLALELIELLLSPEVEGAWSQSTHYLPVHRDAFKSWSESSTSIEFLQQQMESAVALPNGRRFVEFAKRLQQAQVAVLRGDMSVEEGVAMFQPGS